MSLTNDMLNNLDKRQRLNSEQQPLLETLETTVPDKSHRYKTPATYTLIFLIIFVLLAGIFYINRHHLRSENSVSTPIIIKAPPLPSIPHPKLDNPPMVQKQPIPPVLSPTQDDYQEALALIAQNHFSEAIPLLQNLVQRSPKDHEARVALATLYLQKNDTQRATKLLSEGLQLEGENIPLTLLLARTLIMENKNQEALKTLNSIADFAQNDLSYVELLAAVQASLEHYPEAIALYQALLNREPNNGRWLIGLGASLEGNGQKNEAINVYKKARAETQLPLDLQTYVADRLHDLDV